MVFRLMKEFGEGIVPLPVVGNYMNYIGNHILNHFTNVVLKDKPED